MGQAPAQGRNSLRTTPRNFKGRSGTTEDSVWLCSPLTATASALRGKITDPRNLDVSPPKVSYPRSPTRVNGMITPPLEPERARRTVLDKGKNIAALPELDPIPDMLELGVALIVGDDVSTDEILPAGLRILPDRSNVPKLAAHCFELVDPGYAQRAADLESGHAIVAGHNYGQGSSREHAAVAPRYLGLRVVLARSFARIHRRNLVSFGVLPLIYGDRELTLSRGARLVLRNLHAALIGTGEVELSIEGQGELRLEAGVSAREAQVLLAGGTIPWLRKRRGGSSAGNGSVDE
jgi:aconitate hydratase